MKNLIYLVILTMTLFSCKKNSDDKVCCFYSKHFMPAYMIPDSIKIYSHPIINNKHCIKLDFRGDFISPKYYNYKAYGQGDKNTEEYQQKFRELSESYGDTAYYGYVDIGFQPALAYPIKHISITSDKDFDEMHPKGADLSDIAECNMSSYYNFIKSNYVIDHEYYTYCNFKEYCISKKVSDLTEEDLKIVHSYNMSITIPDLNLIDKHNITITIYFENGVIMNDSVIVDFSEKCSEC